MMKTPKNCARLFCPLFTAIYLLLLLPVNAFIVDVNENGQIVVADTYNNRIQVFDRCGNFLFTFGSTGSDNGQFDF